MDEDRAADGPLRSLAQFGGWRRVNTGQEESGRG